MTRAARGRRKIAPSSRSISITDRGARHQQRVARLQRNTVRSQNPIETERRSENSSRRTDGVSSISNEPFGGGASTGSGSGSMSILQSPRRDDNEDEESEMNTSIDSSVPRAIETEDNHPFQNDDGGSAVERDQLNQRRLNLISIYGKGNTIRKNDNTMRTLAKVVRKVVLPKMKFVQSGKLFGSFEYPDFTDKDCWVNALYDNIPSMKDASDQMKAEVWMTYKKQIKEQFSLHRSGVTLKIKKNFMDGEY